MASRRSILSFSPSQTPVRLAHFSLFDGLSEDELQSILPVIEQRTVAPGMVILHRGQTGSGLFFLVDGTVKVFVEALDANSGTCQEAIVAICVSGAVLGEIDIADGAGHTAGVATRERCSFLWLSTDDFWRCHDDIPRLGRNLSRLLARRLRQATISHDLLSTTPLAGRVAYHLLRLAPDCGMPQAGDSIQLPFKLKQSEMASLCGSSRECVNRVFASFKEQGYIQVKRDNHIVLCDLDALHSYCRGLAPLPSE